MWRHYTTRVFCVVFPPQWPLNCVNLCHTCCTWCTYVHTTDNPAPTVPAPLLVAKHITEEKWDKLAGHRTATSGFTLAQAIACTVDFDDQHYGIYAGGGDSYPDFAEVFDQTSPLLDRLLVTTSTPRSTLARQLTSHPGSPRPASSSSITLLFGNF